jgi:hypothetical protein
MLIEYQQQTGTAPATFVQRTMTGYDRYWEAEQILRVLEERKIDWAKTCVVDFGSGVGDYGYAMGRQGTELVTFIDKSLEMIDFCQYRMEYEDPKFPAQFFHTSMPWRDHLGAIDVAIFGEVLEHTEDPLGLLQEFEARGAGYIFTSSYPYRRDEATDDYWKKHGHADDARLAQPACRELLETKYKKIANFGGQMNLWKHRV